jgi:hypothetical protein
MTDAADNICPGNDADHFPAFVANNYEIQSRTIQQSCGIGQQRIGLDRDQPPLRRR